MPKRRVLPTRTTPPTPRVMTLWQILKINSYTLSINRLAINRAALRGKFTGKMPVPRSNSLG